MERELAELPLVNALDRRVPALRRELAFRPQRFGKKSCYVVEDPLNARFFQIGLGEYTFISLLDGRSTLGDVLRATKAAFPECAFTPCRRAGDLSVGSAYRARDRTSPSPPLTCMHARRQVRSRVVQAGG